MNINEVIEVMKDYRRGNFVNDDKFCEAINTVVEALEKPIPTLEESNDKRLLFSAYLQGKRDQIFWAIKWEELKPIGKYRIMKQFLAWYQTLKLKEITNEEDT